MLESALKTKIMDEVDRQFDDQTKVLADLVKIPSTRFREAPAQDMMARLFKEDGLSVDRWQIKIDDLKHLPGYSPHSQDYDDAWNVVGAWLPNSPKGRSLILNGHIDVVPEGPHDMWSRPPFEPAVKDGWMYGRGAGDMKAGIILNLFALRALRALGYVPAADVYQQSVVEEECTGNGALACLQRGYRADAALIPEPSSGVLTVAQVGVMWFQVKVTGHPVHVYKADAGSNAIESAFRLIQRLRELGAVLVHLRHARRRAAVADPEGMPPGDRACDPHRGGQRSVPGQQPADRGLGRFSRRAVRAQEPRAGAGGAGRGAQDRVGQGAGGQDLDRHGRQPFLRSLCRHPGPGLWAAIGRHPRLRRAREPGIDSQDHAGDGAVRRRMVWPAGSLSF